MNGGRILLAVLGCLASLSAQMNMPTPQQQANFGPLSSAASTPGVQPGTIGYLTVNTLSTNYIPVEFGQPLIANGFAAPKQFTPPLNAQQRATLITQLLSSYSSSLTMMSDDSLLRFAGLAPSNEVRHPSK